MQRSYVCFILFLSCMCILGCKKETAVLMPETVMDYYPLQIGKSFTYRLDSTVYVSFGRTVEINSYIAKDSIISTFQDNLQRTSYLVYRYLTDTLQQQPFTYSSSYYITPAKNTVEVMDANNLRFIKLADPIATGTTWNGNAYIYTATDVLGYLENWNYQYQNIDMPFTVAKGVIDSTIMVLQNDNGVPVQLADPQLFQQHIYSSEVYAKGIGLIYKEFSYFTWQPLLTITPGYTDDSYGIKLSLIDYK